MMNLSPQVGNSEVSLISKDDKIILFLSIKRAVRDGVKEHLGNQESKHA